MEVWVRPKTNLKRVCPIIPLFQYSNIPFLEVFMAFTLFGRTIRKIGVIGSGNIGPDIALHFSQNLYSYGVPVVVVDILQAALDSGSKTAESKVNKTVEKKAYKKEEGDAIFRNILFTTDYGKLSDADLVIEAAFERLDVKHKIFTQLEA